MNWFENNPAGLMLAGVCGFLLLVSGALAYVWSRPASSGVSNTVSLEEQLSQAEQLAEALGPLNDYQEVTRRPVFDESRRPPEAVDDTGIGELGMAVADAPELSLSGVVITPEKKMVTLRPNSGGESVVAIEGVPLEGEYSGWTVSEINPRSIVLASLEGDTLELDLQINNRKIEEPPKPEVAEQDSSAEAATGEVSDDEGGDQPLSRAEEIRQRIAERREELRRQSEEQGSRPNSNADKKSSYQDAIMNMIKPSNNSDEDQDEENQDKNEREEGDRGGNNG